MVDFILGPREHHRASSPSEYEARHSTAIALLRKAGARYRVHEVQTPLVAFVSSNTWAVNCECGAGNAVDPTWGLACCFGCGAIRRSIVFPTDVADVEAALLEREYPADRHWIPGESADELRVQTAVIRSVRTKGGR